MRQLKNTRMKLLILSILCIMLRAFAVTKLSADLVGGGKPNIIRATLGDHVYDIPSNYGSYSTSGMDAPKVGYGEFTFEVLLPDFEPRTAANSPQLDVVGWHDQVRGVIEAFSKSYKLDDNKAALSRFLAQPWYSGVVPITINGYRIYTPRLKPQPDLRTKSLPDGDVLVMLCVQNWGPVVFPSCTVYEHWQGLRMTLNFSRNYAEQAENIDRKVKTMMLSFREK